MINHNKEKLYNAILYFTKNTKYCTKTKLVKLLYEMDFSHFKETGKSITGLDYFAWQWGPYPTELAQKIDNKDKEVFSYVSITEGETSSGGKCYTFKNKKKFNSLYFSKREMRILENTVFIFKEVKSEDMVKNSHFKSRPWQKTLNTKGEKALIDYFLEIEDPEIAKIFQEEMEDRKTVLTIFDDDFDANFEYWKEGLKGGIT